MRAVKRNASTIDSAPSTPPHRLGPIDSVLSTRGQSLSTIAAEWKFRIPATAAHALAPLVTAAPPHLTGPLSYVVESFLQNFLDFLKITI